MNKLVSIIIVNYNGKDHLKKCLPSLEKQKYHPIQTIIVDNASQDGSVEFITKNYPRIELVQNNANLGFAEGNNVGYDAVKGEYVLFLNNDTEVTDNFLIELVKIAEADKTIGGVQSKILLMDQPDTLDSVGAYLTNTGILYHFGVNKKDGPFYNKCVPVYSAKGACLLIKRTVLEQVLVDNKIFDERYFAYFEETDLCHRIWLAGYKLLYVPQSVIYHKLGATSMKFSNAFVQFHSFKNRINSYMKNLEMYSFLKIMTIHLLICQVAVLFYATQGKMKISFAIEKAIIWNICNLPETLRKRKYIQAKIRKISDHDLMPMITQKVGIRYYYFLFSGLQSYDDSQLQLQYNKLRK